MIDHAWERWRRTGEPAVLEGLLVAELPRLLSQARRRCGPEADDVVQEGLLALLKNRERLPDGLSFAAAICTVVNSAARMQARSRQRRHRRQSALTEDVTEINGFEDGDVVSELLARLDGEDRRLVVSVLECPDAASAAARCGISANAMSVRLHRLRQRLRRAG